mgnify:CR=1 FL=1
MIEKKIFGLILFTKKEIKMADTKLMNCSCKNVYQDQQYSGKRVHNKTTKIDTYRCTSCGKTNTGKVEK